MEKPMAPCFAAVVAGVLWCTQFAVALEVQEAYGEILNVFDWDVRSNDSDVREAVYAGLNHLWFRRNGQCVNPTNDQPLQPSIFGDFTVLFPSKHMLYQTKDGKNAYVVQFLDNNNRFQRRTVILGITYYFTIQWKRGGWSGWGPGVEHRRVDPQYHQHHFAVTKDRDRSLSVTSHHVVDISGERDPTRVVWSRGTDDMAIFTKTHTWNWLRRQEGDEPGIGPQLPPRLQRALQHERRIVGRIVPLLPAKVTDGSAGSHVPLEAESHASWTKANARASPSPLRVVSYNIWNINEFDDGTYETRMARLANHVRTHDPHIVAFQEVRHDALRDSQPRRLAALLPQYHFVFQPAMSYPEHVFGRVEEGVAVFSKYPITDIGYKLLFRNRQNRADAHQRALLRVRIQTPQLGAVTIFASHYALDQFSRQQGCVQTWEYMRTEHDSVQLFLGDLNAEPDTPCIRFLSGKQELFGQRTQGLYDAWLHLHSEPRPDANYTTKDEPRDVGLTFNTFGEQLVKRIDYALVRHPHVETNICSINVFPRNREDHPASDHLGLVLKLCRATDECHCQ